MSQPTLRSVREVVALVDALPIPALVALDAEVSAAYVNLAMRRLLGVPASKHVITFHTAPYALTQEGRRLTRTEAPLVRAASGEELSGEPLDFELANGRKISVLTFASPIREVDGTIAGAVGSYLDVTDLRALERQSSQRLQLLVKAGHELSDALSGEAIFSALCRVLIPRFATVLQMLILDDHAQPVHVRIAHADAETTEGIERLRPTNPIAPDLFQTAVRVIRTNQSELIPDVPSFLQRADLNDRYRDFVRSIREMTGISTVVAVPMRSHGRLEGVLLAAADAQEPYREDDVRMLEEIGRRAATALQNAELFAHHAQASKTLQEALLPPSLPRTPGITFDAIYEPGDDRSLIGGDWYDAFDLPDGRIAVSIGDVTGRGTAAAALMGKVRQTISGLSYYETDPVKLLDVAEMALTRRHPDSLVTAIVGVLDPRTGEFIYATAGHPPPFVRRADGTVLTLPCHGLPLGLRASDDDRSSVTFRLLPGDTLLLYTDGLTEVMHDPIAGEEQTKLALANLPSYRSDAARYIQEMMLPNGSRDDVAMLSLQFDVGSDDIEALARRRDVVEIKFNSRDARMARDLRVFVTDFLRAYGAPDANYDSAELVLGELLGNAVRHASGPIEIHLSWSGEFPELSMLDYGPPYDPQFMVPDDPWSEGGRGLYIIGFLARSFHVTRLFGGVNETRAELDIPRRK